MEQYLELLSYLAAVFTTASFLPQAIKTIKTKDTSSISLGMYAVFILGCICWLLFGIGIHNTGMIVANAITICLASVILVMKIKYK